MLKQILIVLVVSLMPGDIWAKCADIAISIDGVILGPAGESMVSVQVLPDPNRDSAPAAVIDTNGKFQVTQHFDRYDGPGWVVADRCTREPKTLTVQLHRNGQLLDQVVLEFNRDFVSEHKIDFRLRSPIVLHSH